jgi:hypothetical protein
VNRNRTILVGATIVGFVAAGSIAYAATTTNTVNLAQGKNTVFCPGTLRNGMKVGTNGENINCAAATTTTTVPVTTTTVPVTTTSSTVPVTTTTVPETTTTIVNPPPVGCGLSSPAFCDDLTNEQAPAVTRSGPLSAVWGVSRENNVGWTGVTLGSEDDQPPGAGNPCLGVDGSKDFNDISTSCVGGGLVETSNDGSGQCAPGCNPGGTLSVLAAYPRQPFDIAGRTGTASFSVTDNTEGGHGSWPTWVYTSLPVPNPNSFLPPQSCVPASPTCATGFGNAPQSVGVDLDGIGSSQQCVGVGTIWTTVNYAAQDLNLTSEGGCVPLATLETGPDRFQIQINSSTINVFGASPTGTFVLLASASWGTNDNPALPLTRGLTWAEAVNYNADKFSNYPDGDGGVYDQALNSFKWGYFGFDGPVLPRDGVYDVPDNTVAGPSQQSGYGSPDTGFPTRDISYAIPIGGSKSFTLNGVTTANATGAVVVFDWSPFDQDTFPDMSVSVNGNTPVAIPDTGRGINDNVRSDYIPIPLSELHDGSNTLSFSDPQNKLDGFGTDISNIDLIVQGAG